MYKIIAYGIKDEDIAIAKEWAEENKVDLTLLEEPLTIETVEKAQGYDGVSVSQVYKIPRSVYERLAEFGIKQIAQRTAGYDVHDLKAASDNGIIITNVPVYSPESIAEYVVAGALMGIRKLSTTIAAAKEQDFRCIPEREGRLLKDMTVGILGVGNIGRQAARIFKGFGCRVIGYDLYPNDLGREFLEYQDSIDDVIKEADIVSLHMPLNDESYHLFNMDMFKKMKPHAILLNSGRGALVNTEDLLDALDEGLIDYAFLDVYENEADYVFHDLRDETIHDDLFKRLLNHPQVDYTPHLAFYTDVANRNILTFGLDAVIEVLETGDSKKRVN
ncbi:D-2-hydroxyacid dehydrogenase [Dolosicoccus paucivorans]|uniref:Lactate dehydrogenase n=1 Tax=Dolosicoccus paucivorans TaxID=84521 RepID=A0A1G8JWP4_9LACT|nr:D-2-hydroxyacid dehydrogenase [Dolosicoccus paucivorans]PMB85029.1 lactate dehydrogenase [Dolosicoccus paucivorans]PMC59016.1 lactate dehydrogenase [Dolosicoccus paucivorans]SDI35581.1 D-lactate dehydrogenase [Dolosicoccus paucivorans]